MASITKYNPSLARQTEMESQGIQPPYAPSAASSSFGGASAISPILQVAGLGLGAYGAYQQSQTAQKQYELMVQQWQAEEERRRRQEEEQRQQLLLDNITKSGSYAQGLVNNAQSTYGQYARQIGL